jgi:murein DD-endopeptidase MepM/ murein hydrolase activator NlpD
MDNFYLYIIKSSLSLSLLYLVYWIFFRQETHFIFNRIYLLLIIIISIGLPFFSFFVSATPGQINLQQFSLEQILINQNNLVLSSSGLAQNSDHGITDSILWLDILKFLYLCGSTLLMLLLLFRLSQIFWIIKSAGTEIYDKTIILKSNKELAPFTFFNYIFINKKNIDNNDYKPILTHESIHSRQGHSIDILLCQIFTILHWFNPMVWLLTHSLRTTHEYLADQAVIRNGFSKKYYQLLILKQSIGTGAFSIVNTFNFSQTKRRLEMLNKRPSQSIAKLKLIFVLPALLILLAVFQSPSASSESSMTSVDNKVWMAPLEEGRLTQSYGQAINPFTHKQAFHRGIDIGAPQGTRIYAVSKGSVVAADSVTGWGKRIIIQHADNYTSYYSHLCMVLVKKDQFVKKGEVIGLVGSTGLSTGSHLHFEIHLDKDVLDPEEMIDFSDFNRN